MPWFSVRLLQEANGRAHLPRCKTDARHLYKVLFRPMHREVLILGTMIFLAFSVFRIPYAALIAVLTAAFAFVPYIGAFASCLIGVLLTLMAVPEKAILCFIVYQMVQFMA